jgi:hypothetical protein
MWSDACTPSIPTRRTGTSPPPVVSALAELEQLATAHLEQRPVELSEEQRQEQEDLRRTRHAWHQMAQGGVFVGGE